MLVKKKVEPLRSRIDYRQLNRVHLEVIATFYYNRLLEGFSLIAIPLTKLTQTNVTFELGEDFERSFQELQRRLTSAPIIIFSNVNEGFVVYTDASRMDFDCILMRDRKVIAYTSRPLKIYRQNYQLLI